MTYTQQYPDDATLIKDQLYLIKVLTLKAGGDVTITKDEYMQAMDMRLEMSPSGDEWRVMVREVQGAKR